MLMLLLHRRSCPLQAGSPKRKWYVPGAVVGAGIPQLQAWWEDTYQERAPSERTLRTHLGVLERAGAIVRSPGELLEGLGSWSDHAPPRHPDTIHLIHRRREAQWWSRVGSAELERTPRARHSAAAWWRLFAHWRREAADPQLELDFDPHLEERDPSRDQRPQAVETAAPRAELLDAAAAQLEPVPMLKACAAAGVVIQGRAQFQLAADPARFAQALRALARELRAGRRIRNAGGWLVWVFGHGPGRL